MKEEKIVVTILGADRVGIVAETTTALAKYGVNIEDIKQTIMQDYFVMFLLGDLKNSKYSFKEVKEALEAVGEKLKMEVWVQKKDIFDKMHSI